MKKLILIVILLLTTSVMSYSQRVNFSLMNAHTEGGYFVVDVMAAIPAGQVWHVGASNIRVNFTTNPVGVLTVKADNPAINANPNLSNANGYYPMTTNSVNGGVAIGLNILTLNSTGFYALTPGTYRLASLRWTYTAATHADTLKFRLPPEFAPTVLLDSLTALTYQTDWTRTDPSIIITNATVTMTELPTEFALRDNYPNPFNPTTTIKFDLPKDAFVNITIYDNLGREVQKLVNSQMEAGYHSVVWDATNFASGVYFYKMTAADYNRTVKMILVK